MIVYDVPDRKFSDDVMLLFMVGLNLEKICYSSACRGCREINPGKRIKSYTGFLHDNGFVTSRYLSTHITKSAQCKHFYDEHFIDVDNDNDDFHYDYRTSLFYPEEMLPSKKRKHTDISSLGLTRSRIDSTTDSSTFSFNAEVSTTQAEPNLDHQVIYNGMLPKLNQSVIERIATNEDTSVDTYNLPPTPDTEDTPAITNEHSTTHPTTGEFPIQHNRFYVPLPIPGPIKPILQPRTQLEVEIELMNLMIRHKMPLSAFQTIFNWAISNQRKSSFNFATINAPRSRSTILKEVCNGLSITLDEFEPQWISWKPNDIPTQIYVRPFEKALHSLLRKPNLVKHGNFSFPDSRTPHSCESYPLSNTISELHHGKWWGESWKSLCNTEPDSKEILVPVILYMDGVNIDKQGKHSLTPLNMTLGIFNTATRRLPEAWETLYFHPTVDYLNQGGKNHTRNNKLNSRQAVLANLHAGLAEALKSFKKLCDSSAPIEWNNLPYAGKIWSVRMKFAIAYVIGDSVEHDKMCGRYGSYSNAQSLCRHCSCPIYLSNNTFYNYPRSNRSSIDPTFKLFLPSDLIQDSHQDDHYFKSISHYPIDNAFHKLQFGSGNPNNIHMATPAESLHMHKLGVEKRAYDGFRDFVYTGAGGIRTHKPAYNFLLSLSRRYGTLLTRQSDRDFPRTNCSPNSNNTKKEGSEFAGGILTYILAMVSDGGRHVLHNCARVPNDKIQEQVEMMQLVLGMNRFLSCGQLTKEEQKRLPRVIAYFVQKVSDNIHRKTEQLLKFHLYYHLHKYTQLWGPPCGWDSSFNESHHKTEIKAPAQNTQSNPSKLIKQTIDRLMEYRTVQLATDVYKLRKEALLKPRNSNDGVFGARFHLYIDRNAGLPTMNWMLTADRDKVHHPNSIISFCCHHVLPITKSDTLYGFTEHRRIDQENGQQHIFRAHPSYQSTSGQATGIWYDWAMFQLEDETIPCQIMCFLNIDYLKDDVMQTVRGYVIDQNGLYAVVRRFKNTPRPLSERSIFSTGEIEDGFYLLPCNSIYSELCAVPKHTSGERIN